MQWWKSIVLGVPISMMTMGAAQAEIFVVTRWNTMSLNFSQCIDEARRVLRIGHFERKPDNSPRPLKEDGGSGSAWAGNGEYKAVIKCLPQQQLVFFVVAGPTDGTARRYVDNLYKSFTGNDNDYDY